MDRFNKGSSKSVMKCLATRRDWLAKGIGVLAGGALGPVLPVVAQPVWGRFAYKPNQGKGPNGVRIINGTPVLVVQEGDNELSKITDFPFQGTAALAVSGWDG